MGITVYNLERGKPAGVCDYIGRPRTLGNPFVIGRDGDRAEVITKYRAWLWEHVREGRAQETATPAVPVNVVYGKIRELSQRAKAGEVKLLCHCKPAACHGDVIKACIEWMHTQGW